MATCQHHPEATWEDIDRVVAHELKTHECAMRLKTTERRLFAFVAVYSFLYDYVTTRRGPDSHEWCPGSAAKNLLSGVAGIIRVLRERVKKYKADLDRLSVDRIKNRHAEFGPELVAARHAETTDPDKRIWKRLHNEKITPEKVVSSYEKVKHLLPDEAIANYEPRTGPVNRAENVVGPAEQKLSSRAFYDKYMRSDTVLSRSNKLSDTFSEHFEVLPGTSIKVPRRLERYFNVEMSNGGRFPSNYVRSLVFAYSVSDMFGVAFLGTQVFLKGFSASASEACGNDVSEYSFSKLKTALKSRKLLTANPDAAVAAAAFPRDMPPVSVKQDPRAFLARASKYSPDRKEKVAVALMRSPVAEHERDGYMATWLALMVSKLLGRRVCPQYALLFLVNWAASERRTVVEDYMRRIATAIGLTFNNRWGVVLPVVGIGSGLTRTRMRMYTVHVIRNFVQTLLNTGRRIKEEPAPPQDATTLEQIAAGFFKNNDIVKNGTVSDVEAIDSMVGREFVPCEDRRQIHEEEYNKALMTDLRVKFRFGVCRYQYPLTASSNKQTLVMSQLLKHRLIYLQRETAAALNWDRFVQFLLPPEDVDAGPFAKFATARLMGLNRSMIEIASSVLKTAIPCERVLHDVCIKFNADILTLGEKPDSVLRTKAGLVIGGHAKQVLERAHHSMGNFQECRRISNTHSSSIASYSSLGEIAVAVAHGCVIARDHAKAYNSSKPFLPAAEKFEPIPLCGIEDPIFPAEHTYKDETAVRCNDPESKFWVSETNLTLTDGLISRGILSVPSLSKNNNREIIMSEDNHCLEVLRGLRRLNRKELETDRPRKSDPTPWSSKNTGQSGRSTTEFSPNSIIVVCVEPSEKSEEKEEEEVKGVNGQYFHVGGERDVFLAGVETQRAMAQNDIVYPEHKEMVFAGKPAVNMILAPDISPMYRHGGKPAVITLKHVSAK